MIWFYEAVGAIRSFMELGGNVLWGIMLVLFLMWTFILERLWYFYRVYPGRNRQQFTALGLRPGDLIKDIDGQSLTDPTQAMKIFQTLGNASEVSVTVERNGQPEVIVLRTDQLDIADETNQ